MASERPANGRELSVIDYSEGLGDSRGQAVTP